MSEELKFFNNRVHGNQYVNLALYCQLIESKASIIFIIFLKIILTGDSAQHLFTKSAAKLSLKRAEFEPCY